MGLIRSVATDLRDCSVSTTFNHTPAYTDNFCHNSPPHHGNFSNDVHSTRSSLIISISITKILVTTADLTRLNNHNRNNNHTQVE